ncbi:unnamed protein product [Heterobilharzia americana]|nr:unnamed protein product [Heterobilharzia americana]
MAQKILEPFRKLPHQFQNLEIVKRLHDYTLGKHADEFCCHQTSVYGSLESPSAIAFDDVLGLLAVGTSKGFLKIYGSPVLFSLSNAKVVLLPPFCFYQASDGILNLFELDSSRGRWLPCCHVEIQQSTEQDRITCLGLGNGVIYIGSANGTLRQVAIKNGRMMSGDEALTACTSSIISESVPVDKRDQLGVDSPIISLELQPQGNHLLIAYAGGCVAVAVPQPIPAEPVNQSVTPAAGVTAPTAQSEVITPNADDELVPSVPLGLKEDASSNKVVAAEEKPQSTLDDSAAGSTPSTPAKGHTEKRATLKFKALTRSWRPSDASKVEKEVEPLLPVPPAPRISHLLLRDQPVEWPHGV